MKVSRKIRKGCHWKLPLELMITGSSMPYWIISLLKGGRKWSYQFAIKGTLEPQKITYY
jgi:hypothetical protein